MEPGICTKMLQNLSEKLTAKCPATTLKITNLDDAFLEILQLNPSPVEGQSLQ